MLGILLPPTPNDGNAGRSGHSSAWLIPQMNEGIRSSLSIMGRPSRADEAKMLIESERLWVLLIHIGCQFRMGRDRSRYEGFSDPISMLIGVDKKCLQMTVMQKHETLRRACGIHCKL